MNGAPVTIVGVGPQGYGGILPGFQLDTWLSISAMRPAMGAGAAATLERRADHWFQLRARLADGVTTARAQSAMDQLAERLAADYPEYNAGREITVFEPGGIRIHPDIDGQLMPLSVGLMVVVALVLFIACSNLASLLLLRGYGRAQDVAIRLALGCLADAGCLPRGYRKRASFGGGRRGGLGTRDVGNACLRVDRPVATASGGRRSAPRLAWRSPWLSRC